MEQCKWRGREGFFPLEIEFPLTQRRVAQVAREMLGQYSSNRAKALARWQSERKKGKQAPVQLS